MPLTAHGFVSDPLSPLAWDLFLARLGLAKLAQNVCPDEDENRAIADIGVVLGALATGEQMDLSRLIGSRGGPLYDSQQASFAALTAIRNAIDSPFSPLRREAAFEMVDVSRYIQGNPEA